MIVYYHGSPDKLPVETHTLIIAPAGHLPNQFEGPTWWDNSREPPRPVQFEIVFHHGEAEVEDPIGKYLIATGMAQKSRLVLTNSWNR
jgi:hypothetical protein